MDFVEVVRPYFTSYYVLNALASVTYIVLKTVQPICQWFFMGEEQCQLSLVCAVVPVWYLIVLKCIQCSKSWFAEKI